MSARTRGKVGAQKNAGNPRRSLGTPISLNTSSYSRKDPFLAINTLARLFSLLSSRIGGCHLKLTPEEHKLSLHLLGIIEPFVGSVPSRRTLITRQPTEILDAIVFYVDSKADLLNLALTCQRMHEIVIPRHYDYRLIRAKVSNISVWNHLTVHRSLAKNVRRIEILDERSTAGALVPAAIQVSDTDLESTDDELSMHDKQERYFVNALAKMSSLKCFIWECSHSPISITNVWSTLLSIPSLSQVEINDNLVFNPSAADVKTDRVLDELQTVVLHSTRHAYGSTKTPTFEVVRQMLNNCPNLSSIDLSYQQPQVQLPIDDFFQFGRWPRLTSLTLSNNLRSPGWEFIANFLALHPGIQVLTLDLQIGGPRIHSDYLLPVNILPMLRELKAQREFVCSVLASPTSEGLRPIETLKGLRLGPAAATESLLPLLSLHARTLRRIELASWTDLDQVRRLGEYAPNLTWLDVGRNEVTRTCSKPVPVGNVLEWATTLSLFPNLTTFHGVKFFYSVSETAPSLSLSSASTLSLADRSRIRKNDESASLLVWKNPKLRRVDYWEDVLGKVIVLFKEGGDHVQLDRGKGVEVRPPVRWEVRRVKGG